MNLLKLNPWKAKPCWKSLPTQIRLREKCFLSFTSLRPKLRFQSSLWSVLHSYVRCGTVSNYEVKIEIHSKMIFSQNGKANFS